MNSESVLALEVQLRYITRFLKESDKFEEACHSNYFEEERTPFQIFEHALKTLYKHSVAGINDVEIETVEFEFDTTIELRAEILEAYSRGIEKFKDMREKYDDRMDEIIHEESGTKRIQAYSTLAMHTMHHIGQALLLVNMKIRNS